MPELRKDLIRDQWVLIVTEQALGPNYFPINKNGTYVLNSNKICPFCEGNEKFTPPEIAAVRKNGSEPDTPGWIIRTVPSKYSAFKNEGEVSLEEKGLYKNCSAVGKQEVIIGTPEHGTDFSQFTIERIELVLQMFKQRYQIIAADSRIKYIQIYKNRGLFAGASQEHSHSQIVGLPTIPEENKGIDKYYQENKRCLICSIMQEEKTAGIRVVYESNNFLMICPYASRFSYETWIIPKKHTEHFADISDIEIKNLAYTVKKILGAMIDCLDDPDYNIIINTAPVNIPLHDGYHWFMEITPRFLIPNGMEISTGYRINPASPEISAALLREKIKA